MGIFFRKKPGVASSVIAERRYLAETVPELLQGYKVFFPDFYSRFSAQVLQDGTFAKPTKEDVAPGVEIGQAAWTLNHCLLIAKARYSASCQIKNADSVEARFIKFSVFRSNPSCSRVPRDKKYKVGDSIPVYPCADCKEDELCVFSYSYVW